MTRRISRKTIYILIGVAVFIIFITVSGARVFFHWSRVNYAGEIIEMRDDGFLLRGGGNKQWLIIIMDDTKLREGREMLTRALQEGEHVIVVGSQNEDGAVGAEVIRVAKPSQHKRPKP